MIALVKYIPVNPLRYLEQNMQIIHIEPWLTWFVQTEDVGVLTTSRLGTKPPFSQASMGKEKKCSEKCPLPLPVSMYTILSHLVL